MRKPTLILVLCLAGFTIFQVSLNALARDKIDPWSESVRAVDPGEFDRVLDQSDSWVLVHAWAPDHLASNRMRPYVNRTGEVFEGKLPITRIDVMAYPEWAELFGVDSIPAYILFTRGQEVARLKGHLPSGLLTKWVEEITGIQAEFYD